ncbi:hypothetical protein BDW72DRAFT_60607 [Aspergillus terricola var. indicus]
MIPQLSTLLSLYPINPSQAIDCSDPIYNVLVWHSTSAARCAMVFSSSGLSSGHSIHIRLYGLPICTFMPGLPGEHEMERKNIMRPHA